MTAATKIKFHKINILILTVFLVNICIEKSFSQRGKILCGNDCGYEDYKEYIAGLRKGTKKDSVRSYLLYSNYQYDYNQNLDSVIFYLNKVNSIDSCYISKLYVVFQDRPGDAFFFLNEIDNNIKLIYLNESCISIYEKELGVDSEDYDDFIKRLKNLDQQHRTEWIKIVSQKNNLLNQFKSDNRAYKSLEAQEDSLIQLQNKNNSTSIALILKKFEDEPAYFNKEFTSDERNFFTPFFLHLGKKILVAKPLLNHLLYKEVISLNGYAMYISRYYCTKYDKAPYRAIHCEKDELLQNLVAIEFPYFYKAYQKKQK